MKFRIFYESKLNILSKNNIAIVHKMVDLVLDKINSIIIKEGNLIRLQSEKEYCGELEIFGKLFKIYYGTDINDSSHTTKVSPIEKEIFIQTEIPINLEHIMDQLYHEVGHLFDYKSGYFTGKGSIEKLENREFDAFMSEIGTGIFTSSVEEKEKLKSWMKRGASVQDNNLPEIIGKYIKYLVIMNKNIYKKFLDRIYNYLYNNSYKEI
jgi:hypothetical protein